MRLVLISLGVNIKGFVIEGKLLVDTFVVYDCCQVL